MSLHTGPDSLPDRRIAQRYARLSLVGFGIINVTPVGRALHNICPKDVQRYYGYRKNGQDNAYVDFLLQPSSRPACNRGHVPEPITIGMIGVVALVANAACAALLYAYRDGDANMQSVWIARATTCSPILQCYSPPWVCSVQALDGPT